MKDRTSILEDVEKCDEKALERVKTALYFNGKVVPLIEKLCVSRSFSSDIKNFLISVIKSSDTPFQSKIDLLNQFLEPSKLMDIKKFKNNFFEFPEEYLPDGLRKNETLLDLMIPLINFSPEKSGGKGEIFLMLICPNGTKAGKNKGDVYSYHNNESISFDVKCTTAGETKGSFDCGSNKVPRQSEIKIKNFYEKLNDIKNELDLDNKFPDSDSLDNIKLNQDNDLTRLLKKISKNDEEKCLNFLNEYFLQRFYYFLADEERKSFVKDILKNLGTNYIDIILFYINFIENKKNTKINSVIILDKNTGVILNIVDPLDNKFQSNFVVSSCFRRGKGHESRADGYIEIKINKKEFDNKMKNRGTENYISY